MAGARKERPVIGGFEIMAKVGNGAMGAVYKARQISTDRTIALKILPPKFANSRAFVELLRSREEDLKWRSRKIHQQSIPPSAFSHLPTDEIRAYRELAEGKPYDSGSRDARN